jgi:hypothetical protein
MRLKKEETKRKHVTKERGNKKKEEKQMWKSGQLQMQRWAWS